MELLGTKHSPHTRPLPGRWMPFQNLMSRCTKCTTDTISLTSEVQYDGLTESSSTPHTSRGYQADVSNISASTDDRRADLPRLTPGLRQESIITDSDLPSGRSNNHLGLVFSPRRRAQWSRQQLAWMQALSKSTTNTPPSLRDAHFPTTSSDDNEAESSHQLSHDSNLFPQSPGSDPRGPGTEPRISPPQSPGSNFSEQTRVSITQHLLTDPSSDETDQLLLQSTIVDVYSLQNENTMFNFDERSNIYSGSIHTPLSSTERITLDVSEHISTNHEDLITTSHEPPENSAACNELSHTVFQNPSWESNGDGDGFGQSRDIQNNDDARNSNHSSVENFTGDIWSEDTSRDDCDASNDVSNVTDETTIGASQESAEETVLLDYSENFTLNPISSQNNAQTLPANNEASQRETEPRVNNIDNDSHSQNNGDSSSERNLPVHLISLFENPMFSSDSRSGISSGNVQSEPCDTTGSTYHGQCNIPANASFSRPFPRLNNNMLNPNNQDRWATRIIRTNLTNSQTVRSNASGDSSRTQLQNWYVYDPRLVPGNRQMPRLNLEMHYRGIQQLWSLPTIVGPPDYDDLSTLQSDRGDVDDVTRPLEPPPPYMAGGIPPPTYDEAIFDSLFADDDFLGLDNPVYVDPSPPPTISDDRTSGTSHSPTHLPCEVVLQQLENVLNLNSSPFQSPGDTLTSCATEHSHSIRDDLGEHTTTQSMQRSGHHSPASHNRISSISTDFSNENNPSANHHTDLQYDGHSVPLQSLRSALSAHLQSLHNAPYESFPNQSMRSTRQTQHQVTQQNTGNTENYFNRPAIMYNRSVWSDAHTRNNFGLGNRLSTFNSSPDVSQIH